MSTLFKWFLLGIALLVLAHMFPILLFPFGWLGGLIVGFVALFTACVGLVTGLGVLVAGVLGLAALVVAAACAPLLIPIVLLLGVIALVKSLTRRSAR